MNFSRSIVKVNPGPAVFFLHGVSELVQGIGVDFLFINASSPQE